jgi:nonsense-mediated mRNA decay protein 3
MNLDHRKINVETEETDDENMPKISLQEMLDDLHINDDPMGDE